MDVSAAAGVQQISLDCSPFCGERQDELLRGVLEGTGIAPRDASTKVFGCWTFDFSDVDAREWETQLDAVRRRITTLFETGRIRYGAWG